MRGHVAIGMPPTVSDILSVPLVSAFQARHPEAKLRIASAYSGYLLDWLHRGELDVAIMYETRPVRSLRMEPLLEEVLFLIGPPDSGLWPDRAVSFAQVAALKLFLPSLGHGLRTILKQSAQIAGCRLEGPVEADSYSTLKNLVESGHGYTILPLAPIHRDVLAGRLVYAPIEGPTPSRRLLLTCPTDRATPRLARFAGNVMTATASDLVHSGVWSGRLLAEG